jgi:disulfide bond formation protein DsbB
MVARTPLNVTLYVHCLSYFLQHIMSIYHCKSTTSLQATPLVTQRTEAGIEECSSFFQIFSIANATACNGESRNKHVQWWKVSTRFSNSHKTGSKRQLLSCSRLSLTDAEFLQTANSLTWSRNTTTRSKILSTSLHPRRCITPWTNAGLLSRDSWIQYLIQWYLG